MNLLIFFTALKDYSSLFHYFLNNIHIRDKNASLQIEKLLQKGMKTRYNGYSLNYIMREYDNLTIDVNGQKRLVTYKIQIYLIYVGWNAMNAYLSKHKYNPIVHTNCIDTIDVTNITLVNIVIQFLDENAAASFFQ